MLTRLSLPRSPSPLQIFSEVHFGNHFALEGASRKKSEICRCAAAVVAAAVAAAAAAAVATPCWALQFWHYQMVWEAESTRGLPLSMCRAIGAEVLIDDNPRYAVECAQEGIHVSAMCLAVWLFLVGCCTQKLCVVHGPGIAPGCPLLYGPHAQPRSLLASQTLQVLLYDWEHGYPWSKTPDGPMHPRITR